MIHVAVIEDDPVMRDFLCTAIAACDDMRLVSSESHVAGGSAIIAAGGYDVLLCDLGLPDGSGIDLIREEVATGRDTDILVVTMFANQRSVLDAIRAGARGYLLKDEQIEDCIDAIRNISNGGSPISPIIARQLLKEINPETVDAPNALPAPLTSREYEVLRMLSKGLSNTECANVLSISSNTVGTHIKNIYRKLEVNSRTEALYEASSQGLL
ncbi:MAG: response regulator transcription factor [Aliishimia sp.]